MSRPFFSIAIKSLALQIALAIVLMPVATFAQTQIKYHSNKFSPQEDVRLGRQAAGEAEQQFPLLRDAEVGAYVERVGQRLVAAIPSEFQHPEFRYYFKVINASDINAFALPGGPMYVDRGMIQAARNEGEMAGVMAHELSHVALRHGTAQATKAQKYSVLAGILGIGGAILGGPAGAAAQIGAQGVGVYFLKFSREYETEADLLGSRIMANAGYDPRDLANMFRTIEAQGGGGGGFLSDHPSSKDRYARINQEAQNLRINTAMRNDSREFYGIKERLRGYPGAPTMAEIARSGRRYPNQGPQYPTGDRTDYPNLPSGRVEYPSSRYRTYNEGTFTVSIPDNWREINEQNTLWFAPNGAYGTSGNGQMVFTHAVNLGVTQTRNRNLQQATDEFINGLQQGNSNLRARGGYQRMDVDGRYGQLLTLDNVNEANGRAEIINVVTTQLRDGQLFYMIAVSPSSEYQTYQSTFLTILRSLRLND
ncbi:MAG TPA: M48 family metallopeptidase [Pyrinomonadaceae bacterium]|nr:M48 family metallopeptidase [Pyrinomonadaceae bacterium]